LTTGPGGNRFCEGSKQIQRWDWPQERKEQTERKWVMRYRPIGKFDGESYGFFLCEVGAYIMYKDFCILITVKLSSLSALK
jgi:hypothetical protein